MITAAALVVLAAAGAAVGMAWRGPRPRPAAPAGVVATALRLCPDEHRVRAAIQHADGTAECCDCGAHIRGRCLMASKLPRIPTSRSTTTDEDAAAARVVHDRATAPRTSSSSSTPSASPTRTETADVPPRWRRADGDGLVLWGRRILAGRRRGARLQVARAAATTGPARSSRTRRTSRDVDHYRGDIREAPVDRWPVTDLFWASPECPQWSNARGKKRDFDTRCRATCFGRPRPARGGRAIPRPDGGGAAVPARRPGARRPGQGRRRRERRRRPRLGPVGPLAGRDPQARLRHPRHRPELHARRPADGATRRRSPATACTSPTGTAPRPRPRTGTSGCGPAPGARPARVGARGAGLQGPGPGHGPLPAAVRLPVPARQPAGTRSSSPPCCPAAVAIDWSIPGQRIGDRAKPLADKTLARIQAGLDKFARPITLEAAGTRSSGAPACAPGRSTSRSRPDDHGDEGRRLRPADRARGRHLAERRHQRHRADADPHHPGERRPRRPAAARSRGGP